MPNFPVDLGSGGKLACYPCGSSFLGSISGSLGWTWCLMCGGSFVCSIIAPINVFVRGVGLTKIKARRVFLSFIWIQVSSPGEKVLFLWRRQLYFRLPVHSSPQLRGKLLCYLCTVRVPRPLKVVSLGRAYL